MQDGLLAIDDQRMPCVVATLVTHYRSRLVGQQINDLALALITPLGAQDHDVLTHNPLSSSAKHAGHNNRLNIGTSPAPMRGCHQDASGATVQVSSFNNSWRSQPAAAALSLPCPSSA